MQVPKLVQTAAKPLWIWEKPRQDRVYAMGVDVAEGNDAKKSDYSVVQILDCTVDRELKMMSRRQVAEYSTRSQDPAEFASTVYALGQLYGGRPGQALAVVEVNNHGLTVLHKLRELGYWHLYTRRVWDYTQALYVNRVGFQTNSSSKHHVVNQARELFRQRPDVVRSKRLLAEMQSFVYDDSMKAGALAGSHDDLVMAWCFAVEGSQYQGWGSEEDALAEVAKQEDPDSWVHEREEEIVQAFDAYRDSVEEFHPRFVQYINDYD